MVKMSEEFIDIHEYDKLYKRAISYLKRSSISEKNKNLILGYDDTLSLIDQVTLARRVRVMSGLITFANKFLKKDFDKATKEDVKAAFRIIDDKMDYSVWTKETYREIVKKFYRWLAHGDEYNSPENKFHYPKEVSWISCTIKASKIPRVTADNILTENEIIKLLEVASKNIKNEAMIAVLYETGCRIGEHGSVRLQLGQIFGSRTLPLFSLRKKEIIIH